MYKSLNQNAQSVKSTGLLLAHMQQVGTKAADSVTLDLLVSEMKMLEPWRACTLVLWLDSSRLRPQQEKNGGAYTVGGRSRSPPSILK